MLCEDGAVGGVDVRGSSPGTRETDLLRPTSRVTHVHAVVLSGGSAYGLDAASGVMRYLAEKSIGHKVGPHIVPIVPAAILFDLGMVTDAVRPRPQQGYEACRAASTGPVAEGTVGAGTGATVAKLLGRARAVKGGLGTACVDLGDGLVVGAVVAVNAVGAVYDPDSGRLIAGPLDESGGAGMVDLMESLLSPGFVAPARWPGADTTIGVVATSAPLTKEQANKIASVAHDGIALAIRPAHTMSDGDTMFALATGTYGESPEMDRLCAATAASVSSAIVRGVSEADGLGGVAGVRELGEGRAP